MSRIEIDLNVRVRGSLTYAGFEDTDGPVQVGQSVEVFESESGLTGLATVSDVDWDARLIYLQVDWSQLRSASMTQSDVLILSAGLARRLWGSTRTGHADGLALYGDTHAAVSLMAGTSYSVAGRPASGVLEPSVA